MLKLIDLFAGTGAFSYASKLTNKIKPIFANDIEPSSKIIYENNLHHELLLKDINDIDPNTIPDADIITAGFPCQPFSIAGNKLGFDDKRSNVFWSLAKIIKVKQPRIVILENVKNLLSHENGNTFDIIKNKISNIGYLIKYNILSTDEYTDIPHGRERIYIICFKFKSDYDKFNFPEPISNNNKKQIKELIDDNVDDNYFYDNRYSVFEEIKKNMKYNYKQNYIYQYRRYFTRENKSNLCPTLTANMGTGGHNVPLIKYENGKIRKLTPKECFRFQGFDDNYNLPTTLSDNKLYKLAGNAVTMILVKRIFDNLLEILDDITLNDLNERSLRLYKLNQHKIIKNDINNIITRTNLTNVLTLDQNL